MLRIVLIVSLAASPFASREGLAQGVASTGEDGHWPMPPVKIYGNTRFSGLDQINIKNVKDL